jgi:tetratricopeptide (TPR) repeat protein
MCKAVGILQRQPLEPALSGANGSAGAGLTAGASSNARPTVRVMRYAGAITGCCAWLLLSFRVPAQQPPGAAQTEAQQGVDALQRGDFAAAEQHLSRALAADPSLAEVRANLGLAYYVDGKYAEAVEAFRHALKQNASLSTAQSFLPLSLAALNRCDEALPGLRHEYSSNPDLKLRRVLGLSLQRCLFESGQQAEADQVMQELLAKYPDDVDVLYEAGQLYGKLSSQIYLHLMQVAPHTARGYQLTGGVAETDGNWQAAIDAYREALKLEPGLANLHLRIAALTLEHSTDPEAWKQALEELSAELKINPSNPEAEYEVGEAYRKHGDLEQAIPAFRRALHLQPEFVEARIALAKALRQQKQTQEALEVLEPARDSTPPNAAVHFLLAQLYRDAGRTADAQREDALFQQMQKTPRPLKNP